jgi:hypothetical protein
MLGRQVVPVKYCFEFSLLEQDSENLRAGRWPLFMADGVRRRMTDMKLDSGTGAMPIRVIATAFVLLLCFVPRQIP